MLRTEGFRTQERDLRAPDEILPVQLFDRVPTDDPRGDLRVVPIVDVDEQVIDDGVQAPEFRVAVGLGPGVAFDRRLQNAIRVDARLPPA